MLTTICFYIIIGLFGAFGLALLVASIASLVHNLRCNSRVKKYINEEQRKQPEQQHNKTQSKHHNKTQYVSNNSHPIVITQSGNDNQRVTIGYVPNGSTLHVSQTVQANAGNGADKPKKSVHNHNQVLSKYSRNNGHENKHGKIVPKYKIKNCNEYSKYSKNNHKFISRKK